MIKFVSYTLSRNYLHLVGLAAKKRYTHLTWFQLLSVNNIPSVLLLEELNPVMESFYIIPIARIHLDFTHKDMLKPTSVLHIGACWPRIITEPHFFQHVPPCSVVIFSQTWSREMICTLHCTLWNDLVDFDWKLDHVSIAASLLCYISSASSNPVYNEGKRVSKYPAR